MVKGVSLGRNVALSNPYLGISMDVRNASFDKVKHVLKQSVQEFASRANVKGQFLNWVNLPEQQQKRIDMIYDLADKFKHATNAPFLTVLGIGGSKHTVEHMLGVNGLNLDNKVLFYSDIDSTSFDRYMARLGNDITKSNFLVVSKSGSTFETKDGMLRVQKALIDAYKNQGMSEAEATKAADKHFMAVTDKNPEKSELRRLSNERHWLGDLYIHDDVGGRFSSLDDHALITLAYAGMKKENMVESFNGAEEISKIALSEDIENNLPLQQAAFWENERANGISDGIHIYLGDMFQKTAVMHTQMHNESLKDTDKTILLGAECMHHTSEAMYRPYDPKLIPNYAFMFTAPMDHGQARENVEGYIKAITKANEAYGPSMLETLETKGLGLNPRTAGAMTQMRAFSTVYQDIIRTIRQCQELPKVLNSVIQDNVEAYKKNLKPAEGHEPPVVAGRISINA